MATTLLNRPTGDPGTDDLPPDLAPRRRWGKPSRSQFIVAAIGALALVLYTWGLSRVGMGNSYYAAAVRSGAVSWKAFFFGSIDPGSWITVDKPPAALWVMSLSVRVFGFSSWSMLLPEALAGVGSVLILHRLLRQWAGDLSAHLAALALAVTPVAVVMFRYNNPDALLTLLCLGAAWALWSALATGRTRALLLCGALLGLAFDTKMLQAFLVLPAMALVYLIAGPPKLGRRLLQLAAAGAAMVVAGGWWVAVVMLWPAASRPYIGSTSDNSILSLIFGYNGLSRIFGGTSVPAPGGSGGAGRAGGGAGFGGTPGVLRLFNVENATQVAWLIPLATAGLLAGLWLTRRAGRRDLGRAGWILWGGWAAVCVAVFSLSQGIFHPYYAVQLAPAVAALAGAGGVALWQLGQRHRSAAWVLPAVVVATAAVGVEILARTPGYYPWLRTAIGTGAGFAAAGLLAAAYLRRGRMMAAAAALAVVSLLATPSAMALSTAAGSSGGPNVTAGPSAGGGLPGGVPGGALGGPPVGAGTASGLPGGAGTAGGLPGGAGTAGGLPPGFGAAGFAGRGGLAGGGGAGGPTTVSRALIKYLEAHRGNAKYLVAAFGSQSSAPIIIASGQPVITIGGFNGGDPSPTLAQFEKLVAEGQVRYVLISGRGGGGPGGGGVSSAISQWVTAHGALVPASTYGGGAGTLYLVSGN